MEDGTLVTIEGNFSNEVRVERHHGYRHDRLLDGFGILSLENAAPEVKVGSPRMRAGEDGSVVLDATVMDDGPEDELTVSWSRKEGPGLVRFDDPWSPRTRATVSGPGVYVVSLAVDDGALVTTAEIVVELEEEEQAWADAVDEPAEPGGFGCTACGRPATGLSVLLLLLLFVARPRPSR